MLWVQERCYSVINNFIAVAPLQETRLVFNERQAKPFFSGNQVIIWLPVFYKWSQRFNILLESIVNHKVVLEKLSLAQRFSFERQCIHLILLDEEYCYPISRFSIISLLLAAICLYNSFLLQSHALSPSDA